MLYRLFTILFVHHLVTDTTIPVVTCPPTQMVTSSTSTAVTFTQLATGTDNSGQVTFTYNPQSGSTFKVATTPVIATGSDPSGNTATCTFNVVVQAGTHNRRHV